MCVTSLCSPGRCSLSLVYVFVCVMSVLLLHVLRRCFLEPSHTCFLTSNTCGESDRLLDTHRDRVYQESSTFWSAIFLRAGWPRTPRRGRGKRRLAPPPPPRGGGP